MRVFDFPGTAPLSAGSYFSVAGLWPLGIPMDKTGKPLRVGDFLGVNLRYFRQDIAKYVLYLKFGAQ